MAARRQRLHAEDHVVLGNLRQRHAGDRADVQRGTDSATWQHAQDVGRVNQVTLPNLSKDNVIFGVQALSKRGHASLASFPLPLLR